MLAFPALQAGAFALTYSCKLILRVTVLRRTATGTLTHSYPAANSLQGDCLPLDDGGSDAKAASSAEFPELNKLYG
jgi:hypothetical protein